jgi:hypothetical protein
MTSLPVLAPPAVVAFPIAQNSTGASDVSAVHSLMTKWALFAVAGFLGCCLSLSGQETHRPLLFTLDQPLRSNVVDNRATAFSALNGSYYSFRAPTLLDGRLISLSNAFTWIEATPPDFLPAASAKELPAVGTARPRRDLDNKAVDVRPKLFDHAGGEVGVLYGRSIGGKSDGELKQGYIFGEMGNDKTHISVGAFYEESSGRIPRRGH